MSSTGWCTQELSETESTRGASNEEGLEETWELEEDMPFMLYRLVGFTPGRCGLGVGKGGTPSLGFCCEASPDVDVAGVVDVEDDPTADEFKVDEDLLRDTPLLCPFAYAGSDADGLTFALLFLRRLLRKEGMAKFGLGSRALKRLRVHGRGQRRL